MRWDNRYWALIFKQTRYKPIVSINHTLITCSKQALNMIILLPLGGKIVFSFLPLFVYSYHGLLDLEKHL